MPFLHSSEPSGNHSIHQKYNTYIVRQNEIFHRKCSRSAGYWCPLYKLTFPSAYKNWLPDKTLPLPLCVRSDFLSTGFTKRFHMFYYWPIRIQPKLPARCFECFSIQTGIYYCSYYRPEQKFPLMELLSLAALFMPEPRQSHNLLYF